MTPTPPSPALVDGLRELLPECLGRRCHSVELVGSRITCNPPPVDTDQDVLCYVRDSEWGELLAELEALGWKFDGAEPYANALDAGVGFRSYRHGDLNLVLTTEHEFWRRFIAAHTVAKHLNLLAKADRIALFQAVLYGNELDASLAANPQGATDER